MSESYKNHRVSEMRVLGRDPRRHWLGASQGRVMGGKGSLGW